MAIAVEQQKLLTGDYGLAGAVFSRDIPTTLDVAQRIESRGSATSTTRRSTTSRRCRSAE